MTNQSQQNTNLAQVVATVASVAASASPNTGLSAQIISDIIDLAFHGFIYEVKMNYSTRAWASSAPSNHTWVEVDFPPNPRDAIPKEPGVYVFVVQPNLFDLKQASALLYVGKATSLYSRIGEYISELSKRFVDSKRPHIWRMVNVWNGHLRYIFTTTQTVAEAEDLEKRMLEALIPYFNKELPAETSQRQRAFP